MMKKESQINSLAGQISIRTAGVLMVGLLLAWPLSASAQTVTGILKNQCSQCHQMTAATVRSVTDVWTKKGPDLFYAGNKYKQAWLVEWLQKPQRIRPVGMFYGNHIKTIADGDIIDKTTLVQHVSLPAEQAAAVAAELMTLKAKSTLITAGDYTPGTVPAFIGEMMFDKFRGCLACHEIEPGYGGVSGPEVYTVASRLQEDYLISFMRDPTAWQPKTMMPNKPLKEKDLQKFVHYFRGLSEVKF